MDDGKPRHETHAGGDQSMGSVFVRQELVRHASLLLASGGFHLGSSWRKPGRALPARPANGNAEQFFRWTLFLHIPPAPPRPRRGDPLSRLRAPTANCEMKCP